MVAAETSAGSMVVEGMQEEGMAMAVAREVAMAAVPTVAALLAGS